jgi:hypothetical protein
MELAAYKASGQQQRESRVTVSQCVGYSGVTNVDIRVKWDCNCGTAQCGASEEMHLWSTMSETSVSAVRISRQKK